jgi:DNA repair protein RadC
MHNNKTIKNLPASERPYEKFLSLGASGLSDADLLAIIIKTGTRDKTVIDIAQDILSGRHVICSIFMRCRMRSFLVSPG